MRGALPLLQHIRDPLYADDVLPIHRQDGVVGRLVGQSRRLVADERLILRDALSLQGLDDLSDQSRQLPLGFQRMLAPDDVIADEGEIVTDEDPASERDTDRKALVVPAISSNDPILVADTVYRLTTMRT